MLYTAEDTSANAAVIAKVYWRGLETNSPPWELFQQEQRTADILAHRNIVRTLDGGLRAGILHNHRIPGRGTLRDWLRIHDRLPGSGASRLRQTTNRKMRAVWHP